MRKTLGFTLIEVLVVISIIGVLIGLSVFGLMNTRESARNTKRKSDLEQIRAGLELFKSDCDTYPLGLPTAGDPLNGNGSRDTCLVTNQYMSSVPGDPIATTGRVYYYSSPDGVTYRLCSALEGETGTDCSAQSCGSVSCNYEVTNP